MNNLSPAKVTIGEVVFYYTNQPPVTCFYTSETQRLGFINDYKAGTTFFTIIPYTGTGLPYFINPTRKLFANDLKEAAVLHDFSFLQFKREVAMEWHDIHDTHKLNIKAA